MSATMGVFADPTGELHFGREDLGVRLIDRIASACAVAKRVEHLGGRLEVPGASEGLSEEHEKGGREIVVLEQRIESSPLHASGVSPPFLVLRRGEK